MQPSGLKKLIAQLQNKAKMGIDLKNVDVMEKAVDELEEFLKKEMEIYCPLVNTNDDSDV